MKEKVYVWACDLEKFRGEGLLAWKYIEYLTKKYPNNLEIESYKKKFYFTNKKLIKKKDWVLKKLNFFHKYILPFVGIIKCWIRYFLGYKVYYINYLPLWNFLIFFFLPKKTVYGPITGGTYFIPDNKIQKIIRKKIFPILFKISLYFLRGKNLLFSTDLLEKYVDKKNFNNVLFNFSLVNINSNKIVKKEYDLVIYLRNHKNKLNRFILEAINYLKKSNFSIVVIGDTIDQSNLINKVNINRKLALKYISKSKFSINSAENSLSLFATDCISNNTFTFLNKKTLSKTMMNNNLVFPIDYNANFKVLEFISKTIKKYKRPKKLCKKIFEIKKKLEKKIKLYFI